MQKFLSHKFNFKDIIDVEVVGWDLDYLFFCGITEDLFNRSNSMFNPFRGSLYKRPISKKLYSSSMKKSIQVIGNIGLKYSFGFEEDCGFPFEDILAVSNVRNEGFSVLADFMIETFPKTKFAVFSHGQKDPLNSFDEINALFLKYGPVEIAVAAQIYSKNLGYIIFPKVIQSENGDIPRNIKQFGYLKSINAVNILISDAEASSTFIVDSYRTCIYSSFFHAFKKANLGLRGDTSESGTF